MSDTKDKAQRFNEGKLQWSLVDFACFEDMVRVLEFGARKYGRNNWVKGLDMNELHDSAMRHLVAMMSGERNCPESGLPHYAHLQCNLMFIAYQNKVVTVPGDQVLVTWPKNAH